MPQVINTNIMSLNAQRNLNLSQSSLQTAMERLSSGLRINSAKDDAAGMAISERFTTQIRGLNQAARNANDGISLSQTGEGSLVEVTNNLQRIRELAVQSANATNSASDRAALDQEVQQRLAEIERIATQTSFNGAKLLDGSFGSATFQVGANVGETISLSLSTSMRTVAIGKTADYVGGSTYDTSLAVGQQGTAVDPNAVIGGNLTLAVGSGQAAAVVDSTAEDAAAGLTASSAYAKVKAINASGISGLSATADTTAVLDFTALSADNDYSLTVNGQAIYTNVDTTANNISGSDFVTAINANTAATGVTASFDSTANTVTLAAADGRDIIVAQDQNGAASAGGLGAASGANNVGNDALDLTVATSATAKGSLRLTAAEQIVVGGTAALIGYGASSYAVGSAALDTISVTTVENSNTAITRIDAALTAVNTFRSTFGSIQNRFESTIANIETSVENLSASRSRIQDADFAAETAALTRSQILQQAGVAMLSQANAQPQNVLALLQ